MKKENKLILETIKLSKYFFKKKGILFSKPEIIKAVNKVNIKIFKGETIGLVGESGCGKTTLGRTIIRLYEPTEGKIIFNEMDITNIKGSKLHKIRKDIQMIFQDPFSSLNPKMKIIDIMSEGLNNFKKQMNLNKQEIKDIVFEILEKIGIPRESAYKYPHQFSGGQRQRICIGRAISLKPKLIICDEPLSALDVSIRSQILNLLLDLKNELNLSYLFISHDLKLTASICDKIYIMYLGEIVEELPSEVLFTNPYHPYTQALISAVPELDKNKRRKRIILEGDVPSPINIPQGCPFHPRCNKAKDICKKEKPHYIKIGDNHFTSCWLYS